MKFITLFEEIIQATTFEKYETVMTKVWKSDYFVGVICGLCEDPFYSAATESVAVICGTIVRELGRCGIMERF